MPSLKQLNEAVLAYMAEHPDALITVVVDATFGHRIDPRRWPSSTRPSATTRLVAPPAGAIGRGDAFVLSIANKVNATILSNDCYQEFHGTVHVAVRRGSADRRQAGAAHRLGVRQPAAGARADQSQVGQRGQARRRAPTASKAASPEASQPMPVPAAPPPGRDAAEARPRPRAQAVAARQARSRRPSRRSRQAGRRRQGRADTEEHRHQRPAAVPDVRRAHQPGSSVNAIVENYSSHGAYVRIGDVEGLRAAAADGRSAAAQRSRVHEDRRVDHPRGRELRAGTTQHRPGHADDGDHQAAAGRARRRAQAEAGRQEGRGQEAAAKKPAAAVPAAAVEPEAAGRPQEADVEEGAQLAAAAAGRSAAEGCGRKKAAVEAAGRPATEPTKRHRRRSARRRRPPAAAARAGGRAEGSRPSRHDAAPSRPDSLRSQLCASPPGTSTR